MRLHTAVWTTVLACALLATAPPALAQSESDKAMLDTMVKAAAPGAEHKGLEAMAGSWAVVTKSWTGPGEPLVSKGSARHTMVLGGRYLRQDFEGEFFGQHFEGSGLLGYDKGRKAYVMTWADTMSTDVIRMTGAYDDAKKTYTFEGPLVDPTNGQERTSRMAIRVVGANEHVMEWFDKLPDGQWVKVMEITYTRA